MTDLIQMLKDMEKENPGILKKLDIVAADALQKNKVLMHAILIKNNPAWKYQDVDNILVSQQNGTLDINWKLGEYQYRIVISKRKLEKEKKKEDNNGGTNSNHA